MSYRLVVADLVALLMFSLAGARFHGVDVGWDVVLRTFLPLVLSWGFVAALLGTYRDPSWTKLVLTWVVAVPLGILLRQALTGRLTSAGTWVFLLVGTAFSGLFLALARLVAWRLLGRSA